WGREARVEQPLTVGIWTGDLPLLSRKSLELSDVVSFHNYGPLPDLKHQVEELRALGRPLFCTEYMARTRGSRFETHLPYFKEERVACYNWGLVNGRTQTHIPWASAPGSAEPELWFHDIFRRDGSPYLRPETDAIRACIG